MAPWRSLSAFHAATSSESGLDRIPFQRCFHSKWTCRSWRKSSELRAAFSGYRHTVTTKAATQTTPAAATAAHLGAWPAAPRSWLGRPRQARFAAARPPAQTLLQVAVVAAHPVRIDHLVPDQPCGIARVNHPRQGLVDVNRSGHARSKSHAPTPPRTPGVPSPPCTKMRVPGSSSPWGCFRCSASSRLGTAVVSSGDRDPEGRRRSARATAGRSLDRLHHYGRGVADRAGPDVPGRDHPFDLLRDTLAVAPTTVSRIVIVLWQRL